MLSRDATNAEFNDTGTVVSFLQLSELSVPFTGCRPAERLLVHCWRSMGLPSSL